MSQLAHTIKYFMIITAELTILFLGISTVVALFLASIPENKLRTCLTRRWGLGNIMGAIFGSLTPFCACSTIPMTLGLLNLGVPFGPVMSFVIASPLLNPIIISMLAVLMGWKASGIYICVTYIASVCFGVVMERAGYAKLVRKVRIAKSCCKEDLPSAEQGFGVKLRAAFISAWGDLRAVLLYLLVGVGIGAAIYGYLPQEFVIRMAGPSNPIAIPVAAIIGIPLYIRAETAIPIGLALCQKGMSLGAVVALIIGGAGMAIPEMTMLAGIFEKKLVGAIVAVIFATAVIAGYAFNMLLM